MKLQDKIAIVTGSSKGMGKAIALAFAREGAKVVVNCRTSLEEAKQVEKEITEGIGGRAASILADVSDPKSVKNLYKETLETFGAVDIVVNNAGIERPKEFLDITWEDMETVFHTNVLGLFVSCQEAVKIMKEKGGKIINIASVRGFYHMGRINNVDYSASKAAVINLTTTLAKAVARYRINVNAVAPGPTDTDMAKTWAKEERERKESEIKIGRLMRPEEIASAVLYLASSEADGITGEVFVVDGGYSLGRD